MKLSDIRKMCDDFVYLTHDKRSHEEDRQFLLIMMSLLPNLLAVAEAALEHDNELLHHELKSLEFEISRILPLPENPEAAADLSSPGTPREPTKTH